MSHAYQGIAARVGIGWGKSHGYVVPGMPTEIVFKPVRVGSFKVPGGSHTKIQPDRTSLSGRAKYWSWKPNDGETWLYHSLIRVPRTWSEHTSLNGGQLLTTSFEVLSRGQKPLPSVGANRNEW